MPNIDHVKLPDKCGVYIIKDKEGRIIYVGKANSIKKRIAAHFKKQKQLNSRRKFLIEKAAKIDHILTSSEEEALILENQLIKKYHPYFNIKFKDDKTYPYLQISREAFPSLNITRNISGKNALYYGPFTNVKKLKSILRILKLFLKIRTCKTIISGKIKKRPCLNYQMGLCQAPCSGLIDQKRYKNNVKKAILILSENYNRIIKIINKEIVCFKKKLQFEKCKELLELIKYIENLSNEKPYGINEELLQLKPKSNQITALSELKEKLNMAKIPLKIGAVDISNISGKMAVGSYVFLKDGLFYKKNYRLFKVKLSKIDDYGMLKEVLERLKKCFSNIELKPDILLLDGGKGQLNIAKRIFEKTNVKLLALAKKEELLYMEDSSFPIRLDPSGEDAKIIINLRDEAHRFAIKLHKILRNKAIKNSILNEIEGIGKIKQNILLNEFKSMDEIKKRTIQELSTVKGITLKDAKNIYNFLK